MIFIPTCYTIRMEELLKYLGLLRSKNNYEIRTRVQKDLVDVIRKKEITKALGMDAITQESKMSNIKTEVI